MPKYQLLTLAVENEIAKDIVVSELGEVGYEAFEDLGTLVKAYGQEGQVPAGDAMQAWVAESAIEGIRFVSTESLVDENWNAAWERDYSPVKVGDSIRIVAPFHNSEEREFPGLTIVIQPQMSFGTGHHATTRLCLQLLQELELAGKRVFDLGTGTGVLAIYAKLQGATTVKGCDIEAHCVVNAQENTILNGLSDIEFWEGKSDSIKDKYDLIVGNISKLALIDSASEVAAALVEGGLFITSGYFETDVDSLSQALEKHGLKLMKQISNEQWAAATFQKI